MGNEINNSISLSSNVTLQYLGIENKDNNNLYKYNVILSDSDKNVEYNFLSEDFIDFEKVDKEKLNDYIINFLYENEENKDINLNDSNSYSQNSIENNSTSESINYTNNSNSNNTSSNNSKYNESDSLYYDPAKWLDAYEQINNISEFDLLDGQISGIKGAYRSLPPECGDVISAVSTAINSISNSELIERFYKLKNFFGEADKIIMQQVQYDMMLQYELNGNSPYLDGVFIYKDGIDAESYGEGYYNVLTGNYSSTKDFFDAIDKYDASTKDNVKFFGNVMNSMNDDEIKNITEMFNNSGFNFSFEDLRNFNSNNAEELYKIFADSKNGKFNFGTEEGLNKYFSYLTNEYLLRSKEGQQSYLDMFVEEVEKNQGIVGTDAVGATLYIKYNIMIGKEDFILDEYKTVIPFLNYINGNSLCSFQEKKEIGKDGFTKEAYEKLKEAIENHSLEAFGYTINKKTGDIYQTRYTKYGEDILAYMDLHRGEEKNGASYDNIYKTAFSTIGYYDALKTSYEYGLKQHGLTQRDFDILNGVIYDSERLLELKNSGYYDFDTVLKFVTDNDGKIDSNSVLKVADGELSVDEKILSDKNSNNSNTYNFNVDIINPLINNTASTLIFSSEFLHGIAKFGENLIDAGIMLSASDLNVVDSILQKFNGEETIREYYEKFENDCWEDYKNSNLYKEDFERYFKDIENNGEMVYEILTRNNAAISNLFIDFSIGNEKETQTGLSHTMYFTIQSVDGSTSKLLEIDVNFDKITGKTTYDTSNIFDNSDESKYIIKSLQDQYIRNIKSKEWGTNNTSSSGIYTSTIKNAIREDNPDLLPTIDNGILREDIYNNAMDQFEKMDIVSGSSVDDFWNSIYENKIYQSIENNSIVKHDNILGIVSNQIGNMAIPVALSIASGGTLSTTIAGILKFGSSASLFTSAFGGASEEALSNGLYDYNNAVKYATLSASTELLTEKLFGGIAGSQPGTGWLDDLLDKGFSYIPTGNNIFVEKIIDLTKNGLGEVVEEVSTDLITPLWQYLTYENEKELSELYNENVSGASLTQTALVSFLSSMVFASVGNFANNKIESFYYDVPEMQETITQLTEELHAKSLDGKLDYNVIDDIVKKYSEKLSTNSSVVNKILEIKNTIKDTVNKYGFNNESVTENTNTDSTVVTENTNTDSTVVTENTNTDSTVVTENTNTDSTVVTENTNTDSTVVKTVVSAASAGVIGSSAVSTMASSSSTYARTDLNSNNVENTNLNINDSGVLFNGTLENKINDPNLKMNTSNSSIDLNDLLQKGIISKVYNGINVELLFENLIDFNKLSKAFTLSLDYKSMFDFMKFQDALTELINDFNKKSILPTKNADVLNLIDTIKKLQPNQYLVNATDLINNFNIKPFIINKLYLDTHEITDVVFINQIFNSKNNTIYLFNNDNNFIKYLFKNLDLNVVQNENFDFVSNIIEKLDDSNKVWNIEDCLLYNTNPIVGPKLMNLGGIYGEVNVTDFLKTIKSFDPEIFYIDNFIEPLKNLIIYAQNNSIDLNNCNFDLKIKKLIEFIENNLNNTIYYTNFAYINNLNPISFPKHFNVENELISSDDFLQFLFNVSSQKNNFFDINSYTEINMDNFFNVIDYIKNNYYILYNDNINFFKFVEELKNTDFINSKYYKNFSNSEIFNIIKILYNPNLLKTMNADKIIKLGNDLNYIQNYIQNDINIFSNFRISLDNAKIFIEFAKKNFMVKDTVYSNIYDSFVKNSYIINDFGCNQGCIREMFNKLNFEGYLKQYFQGIEIIGNVSNTLNNLFISEEIFNDFIQKLGVYNNSYEFKLLNDLINQLKLHFPGLSSKQAVQFLYLVEANVDSLGICNYATAVNAIFEQYEQNPKLFEKQFGYPLYETVNGNINIPNYAKILVDLYSNINFGKYNDNLKSSPLIYQQQNGEYIIAVQNTLYKNLSVTEAISHQYLEDFTRKRGISFEFKKEFNYRFYSKAQVNITSFEFLKTEIRQALERNSKLQIGASGFTLLDTDGYAVKVAGQHFNAHIMSIMGINPDGTLIVESWGKEYLFDLEYYLNHIGDVVTSTDNTPISIHLNITSYNFSDLSNSTGENINNNNFIKLKSLFDSSSFTFDQVLNEEYGNLIPESIFGSMSENENTFISKNIPRYGFSSLFNKTSSNIDISNLSIDEIISHVKNKSINLTKIDIPSDRISILLKELSIDKLFPRNTSKFIIQMANAYGLDNLIKFNEMNNNFLFKNKGYNIRNIIESIELYDFKYKTSVGKSLRSKNNISYEEFDNIITEFIKVGDFDYSDLANTEYALKHKELFLSDDAPNELKELFYKNQISYNNKYNEEWISYLEGKYVDREIFVKPISISGSNYLENINEFNSSSQKYIGKLNDLSKRIDIPVSEIVSVLNSKLKNLINDSEFCIRRTCKSLESILNDKEFKNQFLTGTTTMALYNPSYRTNVEKRLGIPSNLRYEDRPIYGMLFPNISNVVDFKKYMYNGPGNWYSGNDGIIYVFDKDKVINNTTFSIGDSMYYIETLGISNALNPNFLGAYDSFFNNIKNEDDLYNFDFKELFFKKQENLSYFEIQLHGKNSHTLENVKEIIFTSNPSENIILKLNELGIKYRVITKK